MEPHLRALYFETYIITMLGFDNASLIMQGVLLEALVKDYIFMKEGKDFEEEFGPAIKKCETCKYLNEEEIKFLRTFKNNIRNQYQHVDIKKISKGIKLKAWKIPIDNVLNVEKFHETLEKISRGEMKSQFVGYDELRPSGFLVKTVLDKKRALAQFLETDKFVRGFAEKYFKPAS